MRTRYSQSPVEQFLKRIVELANYEVTPYGTINPWKAKELNSRPKKQNDTSLQVMTLEGEIGPGHSTPYSINGYDIKISSDTMVVGDLSLGAVARVKVGKGGAAKTVVVTDANSL